MGAAFAEAVLAPFRYPWAALKAVGLLSFLLVALLLTEALLFSFDRNFGTSFFTPDRQGTETGWVLYPPNSDPILAQHLVWFTGHLETIGLATALNVLIFGPLALIIWWRRLAGFARLQLAQMVRVYGWFVLALLPFVVEAFVVGRLPYDVGAKVQLLYVASWITVVFLFFRLSPRFATAMGLKAAQRRPIWRSATLTANIVLLGLAVQVIGLFAWSWIIIFVSPSFENGSNGFDVSRFFILLNWEAWFRVLGLVYTSLVLWALMHREGVLSE